MRRTLLITLAGLSISTSSLAQGPRPMEDAELGQVVGGDGISVAMHLSLNDPAMGGPTNRLAWGFKDGDQTTHIVVDNLHGTIDMHTVGVSVENKPDGGSYVAVTLPTYMKFTNFGFDSLSAQIDPTGPVTGNLGGVIINGTMSMQGQVRLWPN